MPTISHVPSNGPDAAIEEVLIVTKPLSEVTGPQLEVAKATVETQPEAIECQLETADGKVAHDSNAGESDTESDGEMAEEDKAEDKADAQKDDSVMEGHMAQQEHDELKKLIACHQQLLQSRQKLFGNAKAVSIMFDLKCLS